MNSGGDFFIVVDVGQLVAVILVDVVVFVDEVDLFEQVDVFEQLLRRQVGGNVMRLVEQDRAVGDFLNELKVVRRGDDGLAGAVELYDEGREPALRARVEAVHGLVQDQHIGVQSQRRRDGDLFLFAAGEVVGLAGPEALKMQQREAVVHPLFDGLLVHTHLTRAEGDLIVDVRAEELGLRVLKDKAEPLVEVLGEFDVLELFLRDLLAVEEIAAGRGEDEAVYEL